MLAADACYFCQTLRERRLPRNMYDREAMLASIWASQKNASAQRSPPVRLTARAGLRGNGRWSDWPIAAVATCVGHARPDMRRPIRPTT